MPSKFFDPILSSGRSMPTWKRLTTDDQFVEILIIIDPFRPPSLAEIVETAEKVCPEVKPQELSIKTDVDGNITLRPLRRTEPANG